MPNPGESGGFDGSIGFENAWCKIGVRFVRKIGNEMAVLFSMGGKQAKANRGKRRLAGVGASTN